MCTFCLWPQTHSGHRWRLRSTTDIANECRYALENFPGLKEIFFDDDTFNYRKARTIELCAELKKLKFTWSCTSRVTTDYETLKAMKEAGCRLLIVGYESGDEQILKNIKKGATIDMARRFTENCHKLGLVIHGDFIVGLPGETRETLRNTIDFAKTPGRGNDSGFDRARLSGHRVLRFRQEEQPGTASACRTSEGHQLPNVVYPGILEKDELVDWVERFYGEYYFRPKAAWRIVRKAIFDNHERARLYKEAKTYLTLAPQAAEVRGREEGRASAGTRACSSWMKPSLETIPKTEPNAQPHARLLWKTRMFAIIVILSNALGNFALARGMRHRITVKPLGLHRGDFHARG